MTTYDPRGMTWPQWSALMAELFAAQSLGIVPETQWRDWANAMSSFGSFQSSGVGDSRNFATWQAWAYHLLDAMSVRP